MAIELSQLVSDVSNCVYQIDASGIRFKEFQPGVGPFGEPQLVKLIAVKLNQNPKYDGRAVTKRSPDLLIRGDWAIEVKIARPFGNNGKEAESWSVNLLHPYPGNVSVIGDCYKLLDYHGSERRAVLVIGYEHSPPRIPLAPLFKAFEVVAREACGFRLSERAEVCREGLIHTVHQCLRVVAWEIQGADKK
ncbi:MAG TPA: hypothetical protein VJX73_00380 [Terracidiphilus sp.]|nr:hypothetical protein [Terracidiphilus sp.]